MRRGGCGNPWASRQKKLCDGGQEIECPENTDISCVQLSGDWLLRQAGRAREDAQMPSRTAVARLLGVLRSRPIGIVGAESWHGPHFVAPVGARFRLRQPQISRRLAPGFNRHACARLGERRGAVKSERCARQKRSGKQVGFVAHGRAPLFGGPKRWIVAGGLGKAQDRAVNQNWKSTFTVAYGLMASVSIPLTFAETPPATDSSTPVHLYVKNSPARPR